MAKYTQTIYVPKKEVEELQRFLDLENIEDLDDENLKKDTTIRTYTAKFHNGYEADIKVCAGTNNCFIDPVLFQDGCEVCVMDCEGVLLSEFWFEVDGDEFTVLIKEEEDNNG